MALAPAALAGVPPVVEAQLLLAPGANGFLGPLGLNDVFGSSVAVIGDLDRNGVDDLAVGAPTSVLPPGGAVWILFRDADGSILSQARIDAETADLPLDSNDDFGRALAFLDDHDGDGHPELAVGAPNCGPGPFFGAGAVFVLSLSEMGEVLATTILQEDAGMLPPPKTFTGFGYALAKIEDLDEDGLPELAVNDTVGVDNQAVVWILGLEADHSAHSAVAFPAGDAVFGGGVVTNNDRFGRALCATPDLDGDGRQELAIGAPGTGWNDKGAVWVAFLQPGPVIASALRISQGEAGFPGPTDAGAQFGSALAAGDVDGDGHVDLLVGAPFADNEGGTTSGAGAVWSLELDATAHVTMQTRIAEGQAGFLGPLGVDDQLGSALALMLDVEGSQTILAGARGTGGSAIFAPGAVWVLDLSYHQAWTDLGQSLTGTNGPPLLEGHGVLTAGSPGSLNLTGGLPFGTTNLFVGLSAINIEFKGGVFVPAPDLMILGLPLDGDGSITLAFAWPAGIPSAVSFYFQHWMSDPAGPVGLSSSNAVRGTTP